MKKIILFALVCVAFSCQKKKEEDPSPSVSQPTLSSQKQWYFYKANTDDTIEVKNGYLHLSTYYSNSRPLRSTSITTLKKLKGDFEVRVKYSNLKTSGSNFNSESFAVALFQSGVSHAIIAGNQSTQWLYMTDNTQTIPDIKVVNRSEGEFYVKRVGANYTAWHRAGADTVKYSKTNYVTDDLSLNILLNANDNTSPYTSLHVDDVNIIGGGGAVLSDPFDENKLTDIYSQF